MKNIRSMHLYLGCFFAPLLLFFSISGIWQTLDLHISEDMENNLLTFISTIHTSNGLKLEGSLSSPLLQGFVIFMTLSFIFTTILGITTALKYTNKRTTAYGLLLLGAVIPSAAILYSALNG